MTDEENAFLRAVGENPDDRVVRLVYADWLDERDDPRGEYLRLYVALFETEGPSRNEFRNRVRYLRQQIPTGWADAVDQTRLRTGGLYQSEEMDRESGGRGYLRFYPDGTVLSVTALGTPARIWQWLRVEEMGRVGFSHGTFALRADELTFTTRSVAGVVEYQGHVYPGCVDLYSHSQINDFRGKEVYRFLPLPAEHIRSVTDILGD